MTVCTSFPIYRGWCSNKTCSGITIGHSKIGAKEINVEYKLVKKSLLVSGFQMQSSVVSKLHLGQHTPEANDREANYCLWWINSSSNIIRPDEVERWGLLVLLYPHPWPFAIWGCVQSFINMCISKRNGNGPLVTVVCHFSVSFANLAL